MNPKNEQTHFICCECNKPKTMEDEFARWDDDEGVCISCEENLQREAAEAEEEKWATYRSQQR